jgi:hypothetical protein
MRFRDYVGNAVTLWWGSARRAVGTRIVKAWCVECGATHESVISMQPGQVRDCGTMLHQPWCSVDMRNIRRVFTRVVRR